MIIHRKIAMFIKDSKHIRNILPKEFLTGFPAWTPLFLIDTVSMYTNLSTDHTLEILPFWFQKFKSIVPDGTQVNFF